MVKGSVHHFCKWGLTPFFLLLSSVLYGEGFYPYYFRQFGDRQSNVAIVCVDSLPEVDQSFQCVVDQYSTTQKRYTTLHFANKAGQWKSVKGSSDTYSVTDQEKDFVNFIIQFSKNREFQINHTIFPLPVTSYVENTPKKKLVMPRDWVQIDLLELFGSFHFVQPMTTGNNRKFFVFKDGKKVALYNFIYINRQWYFIEKEEY